jgi:hypothetical protein
VSVHRYMTAAERFAAQHVPVTETGCWLWIGAWVKGYGQFQVEPGRRMLAHRYSLECALGRPLRISALACHRCDTPACVNPGHLYEGSLEDNARDKALRGPAPKRGYRRAAWCRNQGESHHNAKLTAEVVRTARREGWPPSRLASAGGISITNATKALDGVTWKNIEQEQYT